MSLCEIKNRLTGNVLFSLECGSLKLCVEAAVERRAYLGRAYLRGADLGDANLRRANLGRADLGDAYLWRADLRDANLGGADLGGADLRDADLGRADLGRANLGGADLRGANLGGADLWRADLGDANLGGADLWRADLRGANLGGADLWRADLGGADLGGADLRGADLRDANLGGAKGFQPELCTPLLMLFDQPGKIRAYKLVTANGEGHYQGGIKYELGGKASVDDANADPDLQCASGINVATLDWCLSDWISHDQPDDWKLLIVEFTAKDIAAIPTATDGKFRLHRCKVVGEKDLAPFAVKSESEGD